MTDTYPADYTVDQVNDYLTGLQETEQYEAERDRIMAAEAEADEPREGILEGPHAPEQDGGDPKDQDGTDEGQDGPPVVERQGYIGTLADVDPEDPNRVKTASEAAPEDADKRTAYIGSLEGSSEATQGKAVPLAETTQPDLSGEHYRQGYFGEVQSTEDLTLAGAIERQRQHEQGGQEG